MFVSKLFEERCVVFQICSCKDGCVMEGGQTDLPDRLFDEDTYVPSWATIQVLKGNGLKEEKERKAYKEFYEACEPRRQLIEKVT